MFPPGVIQFPATAGGMELRDKAPGERGLALREVTTPRRPKQVDKII